MPKLRTPLFEPGDAVLFIDRKDRETMKILRPGTQINVRGGKVDCDQMIGLPEGSRIRNSMNDVFLALRPTYPEVVLNLPREATVIYPKDVGPILVYGDIYPGARVLEAGVGPAALTMALLRAVGESGHVTSCELREDFAEMARRNVERYHGEAPNWTLRIGDVYERIEETELDRIVLDVPEPWRTLEHAAAALRAGGVFVGYLPTVLQVKTLVDELQRHPSFGAISTFETLHRGWTVRGQSIRPEHRMIAHTGFITIARRLAR
jgi:tRNA (adenine57-N1/adenine58-N1)-methyltransferase